MVEILLILAAICALLVTILGIMDVLKSELSGRHLMKWMAIVIIFPFVGFLLYLSRGRNNPRSL